MLKDGLQVAPRSPKMHPAYKLARKAVAASALAAGLSASLTACSHNPAPDAAPYTVAKSTSRPHFFGRHAWDREHAQAANSEAAAVSASAPKAAAVAISPPQAPVSPAQATAPEPAPVSVPAVQQAVAAPPVAMAPIQTPAAPNAPKPKTELAAPSKPKAPSRFAWPHFTEVKETPPMVGGYQWARDKSAVEAAATFAVHESPGYELKGVYSAKVQVVAGTNYSLCLWVRRPVIEPNPFTRRLVAAMVFQGLDQHYELNSWHEVARCHAGS